MIHSPPPQLSIKTKLHFSLNHSANPQKLAKYLPKFLPNIHREYIDKLHHSSEDNLHILLKRLKASPNLHLSMLGPSTNHFKKIVQNLKHISSKSTTTSLKFLKNSSFDCAKGIFKHLKSTTNITSLHLDFSQYKTPIQSFIYPLSISLKSLHSLASFTINLGEHSKVVQKQLSLLHKSLRHNLSLQKFHVQLSQCKNIKDLSFLKSTKSSKLTGPISSLEYIFQDTYLNFDGISNLMAYVKSFEKLHTLKITINSCFFMNKKCFDFIAKELRSLKPIQNLSLDFSKNYGFEAQDLVIFSCSLPYLACLTSLSLSFKYWKMSKDQIDALCCGLRELKGLKKLGLDFSDTKIHLESFNRICESMRQAGGLVEVFIGLEGVEIDTKKVILSVTERLGYLKFLKKLELKLKLGSGVLVKKEMEIFHMKFQTIRAVVV